MQVFSGVDGDLVASVAVIDTKIGDAKVGTGGLELLVALEWLQVKNTGVRIFHADSPALHAGDTVDDAVILSLVGMLQRRGLAGATAGGDGTTMTRQAKKSACREKRNHLNTFSTTGSERV